MRSELACRAQAAGPTYPDGVGPWFTGPEDARGYLSELGRLWGGYVVGLAALVVLQGAILIVASIALLVALFVLLRPIQARAGRVEDGNRPVDGSQGRLSGPRTRREVALRELAFGSGPLREAIEKWGASSVWLWLRKVVVWLTIGAFVAVVILLFAR